MPIEQLQKRLAFYRSKMPTHGASLQDVVGRYLSPSDYTSEHLSKGSNGESLSVWYGFPEDIGPSKNNLLRVRDFHLTGLRCAGAGALYRDSGGEDCRLFDCYGYYMDSDGFETVTPLAYRLNHGRGYLRGYYLSDSGELVLLAGIYDSAKEAMSAAHRYCDRMAYESRAYSDAHRAGVRYRDALEQAAQARSHALELIADFKSERRAGKAAPGSICQAIRAAIAQEVREWRNAQKAARAEFAEYKHAKQSRDSFILGLWSGFADGAGIPA